MRQITTTSTSSFQFQVLESRSVCLWRGAKPGQVTMDLNLDGFYEEVTQRVMDFIAYPEEVITGFAVTRQGLRNKVSFLGITIPEDLDESTLLRPDRAVLRKMSNVPGHSPIGYKLSSPKGYDLDGTGYPGLQ